MSENPFTFKAFANWIEENRRPEQRYEYEDANICACAQYADSLGIKGNWMNHSEFFQRANQIAGNGAHTFGDLHARLLYHANDMQRFERTEERFAKLPDFRCVEVSRDAEEIRYLYMLATPMARDVVRHERVNRYLTGIGSV